MNIRPENRQISRGFVYALAVALGAASSVLKANEWRAVERPEWIEYFEGAAVKGTILVVDERGGKSAAFAHNTARAQMRYLPASTYKIPHALFALEAGVVRDEFQRFRWDGVEREFADWNRDHDFRSSMRHSVVWIYQRIAEGIGEERAGEYLRRAEYGNADPTGGEDGYWLDGALAISAEEQIGFLRRLYRNELPFGEAHQRLVKDVLIVEAGREWILRAKTGWEGSIGWWVGWVEWPEGPVFFALNIDTPARLDDLPKREAIARGILNSLGALPP